MTSPPSVPSWMLTSLCDSGRKGRAPSNEYKHMYAYPYIKIHIFTFRSALLEDVTHTVTLWHKYDNTDSADAVSFLFFSSLTSSFSQPWSVLTATKNQNTYPTFTHSEPRLQGAAKVLLTPPFLMAKVRCMDRNYSNVKVRGKGGKEQLESWLLYILFDGFSCVRIVTGILLSEHIHSSCCTLVRSKYISDVHVLWFLTFFSLLFTQNNKKTKTSKDRPAEQLLCYSQRRDTAALQRCLLDSQLWCSAPLLQD